MTILEFPPLEDADENGILAVGGDLEVESLLLAYKSGIFPWPIQNLIVWFSPPKRTVLFMDEVHISKSLQKELKRGKFSFAIDRAFEEVIMACAEFKERQGQRGTWINSDIVQAYSTFHKAGYAHSIECYEGENLVGGLYGVSIGHMFAGESMFHRKSNTSKLSLCYLLDYLRPKGVKWIDCQVMTPLLRSFGAREIERDEFLKLLDSAVKKKIKLF